MFTATYFIWLLVPLAFFSFGIWSLIKPWFKVAGREFTGNYFKQGLFCLAAFFIAVWIDRHESYQALLESFSVGKFDLLQVRWLLYPAILVLLAYMQQMLKGKKERMLPVRKRY